MCVSAWSCTVHALHLHLHSLSRAEKNSAAGARRHCRYFLVGEPKMMMTMMVVVGTRRIRERRLLGAGFYSLDRNHRSLAAGLGRDGLQSFSLSRCSSQLALLLPWSLPWLLFLTFTFRCAPDYVGLGSVILTAPALSRATAMN